MAAIVRRRHVTLGPQFAACVTLVCRVQTGAGAIKQNHDGRCEISRPVDRERLGAAGDARCAGRDKAIAATQVVVGDVLACRSHRQSILRLGPFQKLAIWLGIAAELAIPATLVYVPAWPRRLALPRRRNVTWRCWPRFQ